MKIVGFFDYLQYFGLLSTAGMLDLGDRVTFLFTTIVLVLCSLVIGAKEYFTKPIACMILHKATTLSMMDELMIESYCWVTGVYPFKITEALPNVADEWRHKSPEFISYYLWVPLLLGLQAVLTYLPKVVFDMLSFSRLVSNLAYITASARKAALKPKQERLARVRDMAAYLRDLLDATREYRGSRLVRLATRLHKRCPLCVVGKRLGNYIFVLYLVTKAAGTADLLLQLELMRRFLGFDTLAYGAALLRNITTGQDWETTKVLPRVGVCRFRYQDRGAMNSMHPYCTISSNIFIEKVYIFLWFYFVAAAALNSASLLLWLWRFALPCNRRAYVKALLGGRFTADQLGSAVDEFETKFLRVDGLFFVWMIRLNCGQLITAEIVQDLYADFIQPRNEQTGGGEQAEAGPSDCRDAESVAATV